MVAKIERIENVTVLIVDDSEFFADMLARELRDRGNLDAESCYSPAAVLGALDERDDIDCVVSDYLMPEMTGLELLDALRAEHSDLPFVLLTGQGNENVASRAIKQGATDYITKETIIEDSEFGLLLNRIEKGIGHFRTERRLQENRKRLRDQNEHLTVLNQMLRHDIRNDLQLVLGYLDRLECHVDETGHEHLTTVRESANNAVDVTDTAGAISKAVVESGPSSQPIAVEPIVSEHVEEIDSAYPEAMVSVDGSIPDLEVRGSEMLGPVVRNLITNGIEHNDRPDPRVDVSCSTDDSRVRISVADNGPGIPDAQKRHIFGEGNTGAASDGTGIGLYLVTTFAERHGGEVRVEDAGGEVDRAADKAALVGDERGSVFTVELPEST